MATSATSDQLLVIIDPAARHTDGESVRIAKDVLSAGAAAKVCLPDGPEEFARALGRRGSRRLVVIGDDRALVRAVGLLHRNRELAGCTLSVVPVGSAGLARSLGVPGGPVASARAVLDGVSRRLDLLVDDSDGVVLGSLGIPPASVPAEPVGVGARPWLRTLVRTLAARPARLRVEVDGVTVIDLDRPVESVSVTPGTGASLRSRSARSPWAPKPPPSAPAAAPSRSPARTSTTGPTRRPPARYDGGPGGWRRGPGGWWCRRSQGVRSRETRWTWAR